MKFHLDAAEFYAVRETEHFKAKKILSLAYYLILEENNSLSRFSHWQRLHIHPFGNDVSSRRSSELFQSIEESERMSFFEKQGKRRIEKEYRAFDITTISSYSDGSLRNLLRIMTKNDII